MGHSVVLVASFTREGADAQAWQQLAGALRPTVPLLIWIDVPPAVALTPAAAWPCPRPDRLVLNRTRVRRPFPLPVVDHVLADGAAPTEVEAARLAGLLETRATH